MEFDSGDLCSAKLLHIVDMMDMVILDQTEHTSHTPHDPCLLTVINVAAAHDMASNLFFQPSMVLSPAYRIPFHLGRTFHMFTGKIMVIFRITILP